MTIQTKAQLRTNAQDALDALSKDHRQIETNYWAQRRQFESDLSEMANMRDAALADAREARRLLAEQEAVGPLVHGISIARAERIIKEARKYAHKWRQCKAIGIDLEGKELAEACAGLWPSDQI